MTGRGAFLAIVLSIVSDVPSSLSAQDCGSRLVPAREPIPLGRAGPQGIAYDPSDGSFWVTLGLSLDLLHLSPDLEEVEVVPSELPAVEGLLFDGLTGITYDPGTDALLVVRPMSREIWVVDREGHPTGRVIALDLPAPPTIDGSPFPKGLTIGPHGSIWLVEAIMTAVYELRDDGTILSSFCHPNDRDGCPGEGVASQSSDIEAHVAEDGAFFLDITGGQRRRDRILRVEPDGSRTGLSYDLDRVGGRPAGFLRTIWIDPQTGEPVDVLLVVVESSAELHVLEIREPRILPPLDLTCDVRQAALVSVELRWQRSQRYDATEILRDGELIASMSGSAQTFTDFGPPEGLLAYEVRAVAGDCSESLRCEVLVGPGSVRASALIEGGFAVDLAEDTDGFLWLALADNRIQVWSRELELVDELPGPFTAEGDLLSGIAYNELTDSFYVYNTATHEVAEVDIVGEWTGVRFPSGVDGNGQRREARVSAMLFDPAGNGDEGSFWYLDVATQELQERTREGLLLRRCVHPDRRGETVPRGSGIGVYMWGMTRVPGRGFDVLEVTGGRIRDGRSTRILELRTRSCEPTGAEISLGGLAAIATPYSVALLRTRLEEEAIFAIISRRTDSWIVELDASDPVVPHVADISCVQETETRDVRLTFQAPDGVDGLEVRRDGELIATLASGSTEHVDESAPEGTHEYTLVAIRDERASDERGCALLVGAGSIVERHYSWPVALVQDLDHDAVGDRYLASTIAGSRSRMIQVYDSSLVHVGEIETGFRPPVQIAAQAIRRLEIGSEIYCLGWIAGAEPGQSVFPVRVLASDGSLLRTLSFVLPTPPTVFVTFPSGLTWDESIDGFWLLERNARKVYGLTPEGRVFASFDHPAPIFQDGVHNYGVAADGARGALFLSTASPGDHGITRLVEMTRHGDLTGVEIALDVRGHERVWGFDLRDDRRSFVVAGGQPSPWEVDVIRAFSDLAPPSELTCEPKAEGLELRWINARAYESISVFRGRQLAAMLDGGATVWVDVGPAWNGFYRVVATLDDRTSSGALCDGEPGGPFIRGDVEVDATINLSDAVRILGFLFLGGDLLECEDAADIDDDGDVNINDAIRLLNFLFLGGPSPANPYPAAGRDWKGDGLGCSG